MYQVGDLIAGYRVLEVLGHGGMGEVYKAAHPRLPRADAIKVLIELERKVLRIDEQPANDDPGALTSLNNTQRASRIAFLIAKAQQQ